MRWLELVMGALLLVAVAQGSDRKGRLAGHVDIGPLSPVERPGVKVKVPPEMYRRYKVVVTQRGPHNEHMRSHMRRVVATLTLSDEGDFSTPLAPGTYMVAISSETPMRNPPREQEVTIASGKTKKIAFKIDTGIR